jgi:hypothetical protein
MLEMALSQLGFRQEPAGEATAVRPEPSPEHYAPLPAPLARMDSAKTRSEPDRASVEEPVSGDLQDSPVPPAMDAPAPPVIQRMDAPAGMVQRSIEGEAGQVLGGPAAAAKKGAQADLEQLADEILPVIKRLLSIEAERSGAGI